MLATTPVPELRDPREALREAQRTVELMRADPWNWIALAVARYRNEDWTGVLEAAGHVPPADPGSSAYGILHFCSAVAHHQLGDREAALASYDAGLEWLDGGLAPMFTVLLQARWFRDEAAAVLGIE